MFRLISKQSEAEKKESEKEESPKSNERAANAKRSCKQEVKQLEHIAGTTRYPVDGDELGE